MSEALQPFIGEEEFEQLFGTGPAVAASAPGRVNLIGEHTDYNGGFVLPTPIPQLTTAILAPGQGRRVRAWSAELSHSASLVEYELGKEHPRRSWIDYVQGVTTALARAGYRLEGFDLAIGSQVPVGSGLSSSAALEVSVLRALRELFELDLDDLRLAQIGRAAETDFVGAPIGIMDQMAASLATPGEALFIDTRTLATERVPLPTNTELIVIDSGVAHSHAGGDYKTRRAECERAAALLAVKELRDVSVEDLERLRVLPEPLNRRARHVVTENQRVLDAVIALRASDAAALGALFNASHASQRDDYEVSVPEVDALVEIAQAEPAVFGARLTGGGFGGSIVALARAGEGGTAARNISEAYQARVHHPGTVLLP